MDRRLLIPLLFALPGLGMAAGGVLHPPRLAAQHAATWRDLHVLGIAGFPLVGVALGLLYLPTLTRAARRAPRWPVTAAALVLSFVYATFYSALDVLAGVGNGQIVLAAGDAERPQAVNVLFGFAGRLGEVGSWALVIAAVVVAVDHLVRYGVRAAGGLLLVPGAWLVHERHIFPPEGVVGMVLLGVGTGALAWVVLAGQKSRADGSSTPRRAS